MSTNLFKELSYGKMLITFTFISLLGFALYVPLVFSENVSSETEAQKTLSPNKGQQEVQQTIQKINNLQKNLKSIQDKVLEANPDLQEQKEELEAMIDEKMEQNLSQEGVDQNRMQQIRSKLSEKDLGNQKQQELQQEYQQQMQSYRKARMKTMQDEEVHKQREDLVQKIVAEMKEEDPKTEEMLQELQSLNEKMKNLQQNRNMNQGQN